MSDNKNLIKEENKLFTMAHAIDIEKFNEEVEDFETYVNRIKLYFIVMTLMLRSKFLSY